MDRLKAQALIGQLREEIRRREAAPPQGSAGVLATGVAPLDALLPGGGFPLGRVIELCGERASGKTTLALLALARGTETGGLCAFVDPARELYPPAARALGVALSRLLLVRPDVRSQGPKDPALAVRAAALLARSKAFCAMAVDLTPLDRLPTGPLSRRLLEAAELGRTAVLLLSDGPSGLDSTLRIAVQRAGEAELSLTVERSRLGPPGRSARLELPAL
jgi:recombination protein RecA